MEQFKADDIVLQSGIYVLLNQYGNYVGTFTCLINEKFPKTKGTAFRYELLLHAIHLRSNG
jgi:hypothetical protein